MTRFPMTALLGGICLILSAAAQAQNTPSNSSTRSNSSMSSTPSSTGASASSSTSSSQPTSGQKDTSRGAKEQQSQKHKCPKNGDTSNPNCKERAEPRS
jgi:hypothetical protein